MISSQDADSRLIPQVVKSLKTAALITCVLVALSAVAVTCGYVTDNGTLISLIPEQHPVQSSTATCLLLLSCAAFLLYIPKGKLPCAIIARVLAAIVLGSAAATLAETALGADWGLNHSVWQVHNDCAGLTFPGPMAPITSMVFIAMSATLLIPNKLLARSRIPINQIIVAAVAFFSICLLICLSSGVDSICSIGSCVRIAPVTATLCGLMSLSLLFFAPEEGAVSYLCSDTVGGAMSRWMTGLVLTLPGLLWLRGLLEKTDLGQPLSWCAFGAVVLSQCGIVVARVNSRVVAEIEKLKRQFESKLKEAVSSASSLHDGSISAPKFKLVCLSCGTECQIADQESCPSCNAQLSRVISDDIIGSIFAEKYLISELLGQGGMSTVYKAQHTLMMNHYAIKVLRPHLESDKQSILRFRQEATATSIVQHPNLVGVHDFGISKQGRAFIVMDLIHGESLKDLLHERGYLTVPEVIDLFMQICAGLACAHQHGIVHRDIKPSNIMLTAHETGLVAKVVDFGLAKMIHVDVHLTSTGEVLGSPLYMSPEQCMGGQLDHRTDIYSLGCVLYECLSGETPFTALNVMETFRQHCMETPKPFDASLDIPPWLSAAVFRMMEKHIDDRLASLSELGTLLAQHSTGVRGFARSEQRQPAVESSPNSVEG
jgi:tRNA A-37 threonylcarbamoyl transferase component Bud32